jgi:hypothetical protein
MNRMRPGTIAAIILAVAILIYTGYSVMVSQQMQRDAATTGSSTRPHEPGAIQDSPATETKKPPLQDSNVPPPAPPSK